MMLLKSPVVPVIKSKDALAPVIPSVWIPWKMPVVPKIVESE